LLTQGEVLQGELVVAPAEERAEAKQVEQHADLKRDCPQIRAEPESGAKRAAPIASERVVVAVVPMVAGLSQS
jgi:hypothetical protein